MKSNEFKKMLDDALKPVVKTQKEHTKTLESHTKTLESHTKTLESHTKTLESHTKTLESVTKTLILLNSSVASVKATLREHSETLGSLNSSVLNIETTNAVYGDMYKINNDNSKKLEKRFITLEDNAEIEAPTDCLSTSSKRSLTPTKPISTFFSSLPIACNN